MIIIEPWMCFVGILILGVVVLIFFYYFVVCV